MLPSPSAHTAFSPGAVSTAPAVKLSAEFDDANAEYDFMEDFQFADDRKIVQGFVARTLTLME